MKGASRDALVATAGETIARGSKSFSLASRLFDRETRERAWLLYAWCRACDDLSDGQTLGHEAHAVADAQERLSFLRVQTARALAGETVGEMPFDALRLVAAECAIPHRFVRDHLEGFAMDARGWRPRSEEDMLSYCYHVAGAVGCMMAVLMGVPPEDEETLDRASDLGIAFQLANIARDLMDDDAIGRCYLPVDWLVEMDVPPGAHMRPEYRERIAVLAKRLCALVERYEASARVGAARLPFRARWAVLTAAGIYGDIAREVVKRGPLAWNNRVVISRRAKLRWVGEAFKQSLRQASAGGRAELWTRPAFGPPPTATQIVAMEIKRILRGYGVPEPLHEDVPIISGLGLDDEDWVFDFIPELEERFSIRLDPLLLTDDEVLPGKVGKLLGKEGIPIARDVSINEIAAYVADSGDMPTS